MILHMISYVYEIICAGYDSDIAYDFICFFAPARAWSNAGLALLKRGPYPVEMHPFSNQMQPLLVPYVCLSTLASKSGCSGLLIH